MKITLKKKDPKAEEKKKIKLSDLPKKTIVYERISKNGKRHTVYQSSHYNPDRIRRRTQNKGKKIATIYSY